MNICLARPAHLLIAAVSASLLGACGGGGAGDLADISGTGIVAGPIDGFGSVITNGVRMDTERATFLDDGVGISQDDLDVGDNVVIRGTLNGNGTGTATTVITDEFLKGPVTGVNTADMQFESMGQTVNVDLSTLFDGVTFETLAAGNLVEVHGTLDANDEIRATRVELKTALTEYEVTGFIDGVGGNTFTINGLIVNFETASVSTEGGASLRAGMYVDVEASSPPSGTTLVAREVEEEDRVPGLVAGDEAEIEGLITNLISATRFVLNGITVEYGAGTVFEDGSASDLALNVKVEAEGRFDANGVLQARKIEVKRALNVRVTTTVDAVDSTAGTFTVLGKVFRTDAQTQFEDERDDVRPFRLANLSVGDYVEVGAYIAGNDLIASRVEREDDDTELELRGPVDAPDPAASPFSILGIEIATDGGTSFEGLNDASISSATFYETVGPGDVVEIKQDTRGTPIVADEVEIEELVP